MGLVVILLNKKDMNFIFSLAQNSCDIWVDIRDIKYRGSLRANYSPNFVSTVSQSSFTNDNCETVYIKLEGNFGLNGPLCFFFISIE